MDKELILYAAGATMLMGIVALLLFFICRWYRKNHRKNVLINMALEALDEVFPRIAKINYRTAECVFIRAKSEETTVPFETYDWYEFRIPFLEAIYPEDQERVRTFTSLEHMRRIRENELRSDTCICKSRQNSAEYQWMQMLIIPAKEPDCVMIYTRDADESVRAEELYKEQLWEMLQKSRDEEASKTEFLRYMCHDLRIPLNAMMESNTLARETIGQGEQQVRDYLARAESIGNYILTMLDDIFQVSIFREWRVRTSKRPFSMREIMHNCYDYCMRMGAGEKNITLKMELDENLKQRYNGDESRLTQLLNALLANACKFNCQGGKILLKAWLEETGYGWDEVAVLVQDTGCGISWEQLVVIRELFARDRHVSMKMTEGIGWGFFFVKRALDAIEGRIQAESKEGEGSSFTVRLKLEHVEAPAERAKEDLQVQGPAFFSRDVCAQGTGMVESAGSAWIGESHERKYNRK